MCRSLLPKEVTWYSLRSISSGSKDDEKGHHDKNVDAEKEITDKETPGKLELPNYEQLASRVLNSKQKKIHRKSNRTLLLPRVNSTDHLGQDEVQTEGLFAGYKPLFLGNSSIDMKTPELLDGLFSSLTKIKKATDDSKNGEIDVQDILEDMQKSEPLNASMRYENGKKPIIPWDASISGMMYNDQPFKGVPRTIVGKLKPFKLMRIEKKSKPKIKAHEMIKMQVYNSKINDEPEMVDMFQKSSCKSYHPNKTTVAASAQRKHYMEMTNYALKFKFVKSDRHVFKTDVDKLNRFLAKEFHKLTKLTIHSQFTECQLPLYIYVDKSISSKSVFQNFLRKRIMNHIEPLLTTILSSYDTEEQARKFKFRVMIKVNTIVKDLSEYLPSVYFTGDVIDCILHPSPILGFGRIHWLKPTKRHNVFWGRNADNDFVFNLKKDYRITRSGVRYMKYPINLHWKTFGDAFTEWDYFT